MAVIVSVNDPKLANRREFKLRWNGQRWLDAAGNRWNLDDKTGVFSCPRWGKVNQSYWWLEGVK